VFLVALPSRRKSLNFNARARSGSKGPVRSGAQFAFLDYVCFTPLGDCLAFKRKRASAAPLLQPSVLGRQKRCIQLRRPLQLRPVGSNFIRREADVGDAVLDLCLDARPEQFVADEGDYSHSNDDRGFFHIGSLFGCGFVDLNSSCRGAGAGLM
jgi:hypothetical protein